MSSNFPDRHGTLCRWKLAQVPADKTGDSRTEAQVGHRSCEGTSILSIGELGALRWFCYLCPFQNGFIHRDIAARNCLLTDQMVLKIADFGLTMKRNEIQMDNLGKVPVKWLAKEVEFSDRATH